MRYIVKNKDSGRFLGSFGEWTASSNLALLFPNGLSVMLHLESLAPDKKNVEVIKIGG